jgi:hypothetical protein
MNRMKRFLAPIFALALLVLTILLFSCAKIPAHQTRQSARKYDAPPAICTENENSSPQYLPQENRSDGIHLQAKTENSDAKMPQTPSNSETAEAGGEAVTNDITAGAEAKTQNTAVLSITGIDDQQNILPIIEVEFNSGETVLDLLLRVTRSKKIQMEFSGSKSNGYVRGIDNLYEFDKGPGSGWIVSVNGAPITVSSGAYFVEEGDIIEWRYTKDLGKDIKANP